jgi:hypothetical protein
MRVPQADPAVPDHEMPSGASEYAVAPEREETVTRNALLRTMMGQLAALTPLSEDTTESDTDNGDEGTAAAHAPSVGNAAPRSKRPSPFSSRATAVASVAEPARTDTLSPGAPLSSVKDTTRGWPGAHEVEGQVGDQMCSVGGRATMNRGAAADPHTPAGVYESWHPS